MNASQVLHRVPPKVGESILGYLIRSAERNSLGGPREILSTLDLPQDGAIDWCHIPRLTEYLRCLPDELVQLGGIRETRGGLSSIWHFGESTCSAERFVRSRCEPVCPQCLAEHDFVRSCWGISLYTACAAHGARLVTMCDACKRPILSRRSRVAFCACGRDLRRLLPDRAETNETLVSAQIDRALEGETYQFSPPNTAIAVDRLSLLSLDGLLSTVWLLGQVLPALEQSRSVNGRLKPEFDTSSKICDAAIQTLSDWPTSFLAQLETVGSRPNPPGYSTSSRKWFAPLVRFFSESEQSSEMNFMKKAFEFALRQQYLKERKTGGVWASYQQREFDFDC